LKAEVNKLFQQLFGSAHSIDEMDGL